MPREGAIFHGCGSLFEPLVQTWRIDQEDYYIGTGDVFVINGSQSHGYKNSQGLSIFNVYFDLDRLLLPLHDIREIPGFHALFTLEPQYRARHRFRSKLTLSPDALMPLQTVLGRLENEFRHRRPGFQAATASIFTEIVVYLSRVYSESPPPASRTLLGVGKIISHIENHYDKPLTISQLASLSHVSPSTLDRNFRRAMGCAPIDYLIRVRIMRAAKLLQEGNLSITEIAYRVGFGDSNYFSRQFKKLTGCTPRRYRQQPI